MTDAQGAKGSNRRVVGDHHAVPDMPATVTPLVYAIPATAAYHTAVVMGTDVTSRGTSQSVTVE